MSIKFQIKALPISTVRPLLTLSDEELLPFNARWLLAEAKPGFPCRVSLVDAEVGERVLALSYAHLNTHSPYRACGPIFVRQNASAAAPEVNEIPEILRSRLLSVRAYDARDMMLGAEIVEGHDLAAAIWGCFADAKSKYLHIHNAKPGCFNCAVYRA